MKYINIIEFLEDVFDFKPTLFQKVLLKKLTKEPLCQKQLHNIQYIAKTSFGVLNIENCIEGTENMLTTEHNLWLLLTTAQKIQEPTQENNNFFIHLGRQSGVSTMLEFMKFWEAYEFLIDAYTLKTSYLSVHVQELFSRSRVVTPKYLRAFIEKFNLKIFQETTHEIKLESSDKKIVIFRSQYSPDFDYNHEKTVEKLIPYKIDLLVGELIDISKLDRIKAKKKLCAHTGELERSRVNDCLSFMKTPSGEAYTYVSGVDNTLCTGLTPYRSSPELPWIRDFVCRSIFEEPID